MHDRHVDEPRINVTFRWILNHKDRGGCGIDTFGVRVPQLPINGISHILYIPTLDVCKSSMYTTACCVHVNCTTKCRNNVAAFLNSWPATTGSLK